MDKTRQEIIDQYRGKITAVLLNTECMRQAFRVTGMPNDGIPKGRKLQGDKGVYSFEWARPGTGSSYRQEARTRLYKDAVTRGAPPHELVRLAKDVAPNVLAGQLEMPVEQLCRSRIVKVADWVPDF